MKLYQMTFVRLNSIVLFFLTTIFNGLVVAAHVTPEENIGGVKSRENKSIVRALHDNTVIAYLTKELSRDPRSPRANEYRHLLQQHQLTAQRQFGDDVSVNNQQPVVHQPLPSGGSDAIREQGYGPFADSLSNNELYVRLAVIESIEEVVLDKLRLEWKTYAKCGGPLFPNILSLQRMLLSTRQERHKIGAVQMFRQCAELRRDAKLSKDQRRTLDEQKSAYERAKCLQLTLFTIPDDEDFYPLISEVGEWVEELVQQSVDAGRSFIGSKNS